MAEATEEDILAKKQHESRTSAVRTYGLDMSKIAKDAMDMSKMARLGHAISQTQSPSSVQSASLMCPRCRKAVSIAKLNDGEEAGYCSSCRYAMPLAKDGECDT